MISEFLAFRYIGIRRIDEIRAQPSDIGWKCRKYIKWRDIHNNKEDAKALYTFAEELLDKKNLRLDLYGQICGVFLNVQKWRADKEKRLIEPPLRKEWRAKDVLIKATQTAPGIFAAKLAERKVNCAGRSSTAIQTLFYLSELDELCRSQGIAGYPEDEVLEGFKDAKAGEVGKAAIVRLFLVYESVGLKAPILKDAARFLERMLKDLGFEDISINPDIAVPEAQAVVEREYVLELVPLDKFRLVEVANHAGITSIRINVKHPFIATILEGGTLPPGVEQFIKVYADCMSRMAGSVEAIETFNSYLGLELHGTRIPSIRAK